MPLSMQSFLIMTKAVGDSGLNKIQVPLYWFPRNLWGLLSSWWKQYNRKLDICTIPPSLKPINPSGDGCPMPPFPVSEEGMGLIAGGAGMCDTGVASFSLRQNCLQGTGI